MTKYSFSIIHHTNLIVPFEIVGIYRSSACANNNAFLSDLEKLARPQDKICVIFGDFNIQFQKEPRHFIINEIHKMNFVQLIHHPTHRDGGTIDHLYIYKPDFYNEVQKFLVEKLVDS